MTFEGSFLIIFGFLIGAFLLLGVAQVVGWITGKKSKFVKWAMVLIVVMPIAFSLYLDNSGQVRTVRVADKSDHIRRDTDGSWQRTLSLIVEYDKPDETLPVRLSVRSDHETFDQLQIGQTTEVRMQDFGGAFQFAWLKHRSTFSLLRDLFPRQPKGNWRSGTAVIREVIEITDYHANRTSYELRWPYEVVEFSFVPEGRTEPVIALDRIEAGSVGGLIQNAAVSIQWPEDDPRSARIVGATPAAPFKNWLHAFMEEIFIAVVFFGGIAVLIFVFRRFKKRLLHSR